MDGRHIFVSVGRTATEQQEQFVCAVEDRLRAEGLVPHTVGRNTFTSDAPLKAVSQLLTQCSGAVVIALERTHFDSGTDRRGGSKQISLGETMLATPWNQIEAAMSYSAGIPLMVIVGAGVRMEGQHQPGYDWYVQEVQVSPSALSSTEFNGVIASWKQKVIEKPLTPKSDESFDPAEITVGRLLMSLKPAQLWSILGGLAAALAAAFTLGAHLIQEFRRSKGMGALTDTLDCRWILRSAGRDEWSCH